MAEELSIPLYLEIEAELARLQDTIAALTARVQALESKPAPVAQKADASAYVFKFVRDGEGRPLGMEVKKAG
jgi:hypothetical protein